MYLPVYKSHLKSTHTHTQLLTTITAIPGDCVSLSAALPCLIPASVWDPASWIRAKASSGKTVSSTSSVSRVKLDVVWRQRRQTHVCWRMQRQESTARHRDRSCCCFPSPRHGWAAVPQTAHPSDTDSFHTVQLLLVTSPHHHAVHTKPESFILLFVCYFYPSKVIP